MTACAAWARAGAAGLCLLALPPARALLEGSMLAHQLVQLPLLAACGYLLGRGLRAPLAGALPRLDPGGLTGLAALISASLFWMLPRYLDAAVAEGLWEGLKFVTVPLLVGLPLALSWPRAHPLLRGLLKAELFVMLLRLAWLYLDSPVRLCSNYLLTDQRDLARGLLALACAWACWELLRFFFGDHAQASAAPRDPASR